MYKLHNTILFINIITYGRCLTQLNRAYLSTKRWRNGTGNYVNSRCNAKGERSDTRSLHIVFNTAKFQLAHCSLTGNWHIAYVSLSRALRLTALINEHITLLIASVACAPPLLYLLACFASFTYFSIRKPYYRKKTARCRRCLFPLNVRRHPLQV